MKLSRIFVRDAQTQRLAGEWGVARTRTCAMHPRQIWLIELHAQWRTYDFQIGCSDLVALSQRKCEHGLWTKQGQTVASDKKK
jgi:hypothetical protein